LKKTTLKINLTLVVILLFFIISLEPTIGRNDELVYFKSDLTESNKLNSAIECDLFSDLIVTQSTQTAKIHVLLGNGTGEFLQFQSYTTGGSFIYDLVVEDFNQDGFLDFVIAYNFYPYVYKFSIYLGEGYGMFAEPVNYSTTSANDGIKSGDFNNDDNMDLAILCHYSNGDSIVDVFLGEGNGSFGPKWSMTLPESSADRLTAVDLDNDNDLDLAIVCDYLGDGYLTIAFGNGTGQFTVDQSYATGNSASCTDIASGDFNLDGFLDLAVTIKYDNDVSVFYNDGEGTFTNRQDYPTGNSPKSIITEDFNLDGFLDLAVAINDKVSILIGNETGGFSNPVKYDVGTSHEGNDIVAHDFDGDDLLDLVVSNVNGHSISFLHGYGDGTFGDRKDTPVGKYPWEIAVGNFNPILTPGLNCDGDLSWFDVACGSNVTGAFIIENIGDIYSRLNWEIESYPDWGTWVFTPSSGQNMTPEDGVLTVEVDVIAPEEKNTEVTGEVKIVNSDNSSDYCIVDVVLSTPKNKPFNIIFYLQGLLERFPLLQRLLSLPILNRLLSR